jgi:hypothetical protein
MKTSESITNLTAALLEAASKIRPLVKDSNNPFFNSKYADVNQTIEALKDVLLQHDIWFMQFPHSTENSVGVVTRVIHSSGEFIEHEYVLPLAKRDPQAAGSAITYARRYALVSIFGLQAVDDDAQSAMPVLCSPEDQHIIRELIKQTSSDESKLCQNYGVTKIESLNSAQSMEAIALLETKRRKQNASA